MEVQTTTLIILALLLTGCGYISDTMYSEPDGWPRYHGASVDTLCLKIINDLADYPVQTELNSRDRTTRLIVPELSSNVLLFEVYRYSSARKPAVIQQMVPIAVAEGEEQQYVPGEKAIISDLIVEYQLFNTGINCGIARVDSTTFQ